MASLGDAEASAEYRFEIPEAGYYDIAVRLCFPYWDKNAIVVSLDGNAKTFSESRLWWPYWKALLAALLKVSFFRQVRTLSASAEECQESILRISGVQQFCRVPFAGEAVYMLSPGSLRM